MKKLRVVYLQLAIILEWRFSWRLILFFPVQWFIARLFNVFFAAETE